MKLPPRTTHALALASLLALAPTCPHAHALHAAASSQQQSQPKKRGQRGPNARERRERALAVAALIEAAEVVRPADDLYEAVRLRAEIAEVLWPHDAASARAMLRRAWEAANAPGAEDRVVGLGVHDDAREDAQQTLHTARRSVVKTALRHDPPLGEEFMRQFEREVSSTREATPEGAEAAAPSSSVRSARAQSRAGWQRLLVATQFLEEGDAARAAAAAAPVVAEGPTPLFLDFLARLRARAPREADALYLRLVESTRAAPSASVHDVLLLSAPVVSPTLRAQIERDGSIGFVHLPQASAATPMPAPVRRAFFNFAAALLLRPRAHADDAAHLYFAAARLLPFFEREAPQHAAALHALVASIAADLEAARRDTLSARASVSSLAPKNPVDTLASSLKAVESAPNAIERDRERFLLVAAAARRKLWDRARTAAAVIEDEETRRNARRLISIHQVMDTLHAFEDDEQDKQAKQDTSDKDDVGRAADFVRAADVPPEVRAAGFAQAAELAARRGQTARVAELLGEAATHAEQSERAGGRRTLALALVALSAARAREARTWDALAALVGATNEEEGDDFDFAALVFSYTFNHLGGGVTVTTPREALDLRAVFAAAAPLDAARTLAEARTLKDEVARANMLFAAARAVLDGPKTIDAKSAP